MNYFGKLFISISLVDFFSGVFLIVSFETNSSVFSFCFTFSVSMELGEKLSWFVLTVVSLCGCIFVQSVCPEALGQSWSWGGQGHPFPGRAGNCHLDGRGWGRHEPEPSVSKGFSCAQWLSQPYLARQVPRGWSRSHEGQPQFSSTPCKCAPPPHPWRWHLCPRGGQSWRKACWSSPWHGCPCMWCNPGTLVRAPDPASLAPLSWLPCPIHMCMCSCVWSFVKVLKLGTLNNLFDKQGKYTW